MSASGEQQALQRADGDRAGGYRRLGEADRAAVFRHLSELGSEGRERRFGCTLSSAAIASYVDALDFAREAVLAVEARAGAVVAMAQVIPLNSEGDAEVAISVLPQFQGQGLGQRLMQAATAHAGDSGVRRLVAQVSASNRPMLAVCRRAGMRLQRDATDVVGVLELAAEAVL
jgi:ribosomal protein S18 acetylase RimI-like enzyme